MTTTVQIQDSFQEYFSYLCVFSMEGELLEYVVNLDPINESYVNCHKAIQECSSSNVEMILMDAQYKDIVSKIDRGAIQKVNLVMMKPSDFVKEYSELFLDDE